jgi:hypothetical protein
MALKGDKKKKPEESSASGEDKPKEDKPKEEKPEESGSSSSDSESISDNEIKPASMKGGAAKKERQTVTSFPLKVHGKKFDVDAIVCDDWPYKHCGVFFETIVSGTPCVRQLKYASCHVALDRNSSRYFRTSVHDEFPSPIMYRKGVSSFKHYEGFDEGKVLTRITLSLNVKAPKVGYAAATLLSLLHHNCSAADLSVPRVKKINDHIKEANKATKAAEADVKKKSEPIDLIDVDTLEAGLVGLSEDAMNGHFVVICGKMTDLKHAEKPKWQTQADSVTKTIHNPEGKAIGKIEFPLPLEDYGTLTFPLKIGAEPLDILSLMILSQYAGASPCIAGGKITYRYDEGEVAWRTRKINTKLRSATGIARDADMMRFSRKSDSDRDSSACIAGGMFAVLGGLPLKLCVDLAKAKAIPGGTDVSKKLTKLA